MMRSRHPLCAVAALTLFACTSRETTQPALRAPGQSHRYAASSSPTDTLHIAINGRTSVRTASIQQYHATVSNGTATRYYYQWSTLDCASYCSTTPLEPFAEGEGLSTISVEFGVTNDQKDISVHVTELDGTGRAGSYRLETEGPNMAASGTGLINAPCDYYNDIFYPLSVPVYDPFTGTTVTKPGRRNNCDNSITIDPNS